MFKVKLNQDLAVCPMCESDAAALGDFNLIKPEDESNDVWYAHVLCGDCHTWRYVEAPEADFQAWESHVIDAFAAVIHRDADRLDTDRFKDWAAVFIGSLRHDVILPEDF